MPLPHNQIMMAKVSYLLLLLSVLFQTFISASIASSYDMKATQADWELSNLSCSVKLLYEIPIVRRLVLEGDNRNNLRAFLAEAFTLLDHHDTENFEQWISRTAWQVERHGVSLDDFCGIFRALLIKADFLHAEKDEGCAFKFDMICFHESGQINRNPFRLNTRAEFIVLLYEEETSINPSKYSKFDPELP